MKTIGLRGVFFQIRLLGEKQNRQLAKLSHCIFLVIQGLQKTNHSGIRIPSKINIHLLDGKTKNDFWEIIVSQTRNAGDGGQAATFKKQVTLRARPK